MASNVVKVTLLADAKGFQKGMAQADAAAKKTEGKASEFKGAMQGIFAGAAAAAVVGFAKEAVGAFSDVEQSAGSVESVFGDSAQSIKDQAEGAAEAFGLSASEFQTSAALIGSMLKNQLGLSAEEAAGQVDDLTGKAADMAATFGGTTSEAIDAIGSLLRGERDPIEKYGVSMNDAAIKARALELGLADVTGEIGPAAKATAALDILNEQTADSTGQFARESDTLAGSQQILAANIENTKSKIGELLAPAVTSATGAFSDMITVADVLIDRLNELQGSGGTAGLPGVSDAAIGMIPIIGQVYQGFQNFKTAIGGVADTLSRDAQPAMEDARTHGLEPLTGATDDQTAAEGDLAGAIQTTIELRQESFDQVQGQLDKFFAYTEAVDDQAAAQQAVNDAVKEFGKGSPEHIEALKNKAEATRDVEGAELDLLTSGGLTREEFEKQRVKMGLTAAEAQILIDKYDILFTPRSVSHDIVFRESTRKEGHSYAGTQQGGYVQGGVPRLVGEKGPEIFTPNTGGRVTPNSAIGPAMRGGGGGTVNNITIHAGLGSDPNAISRALVEALQRYQRANGAVPIRTR